MRVNNKILFSISNTVRTFEVLFISIFLSRFIDDKNALGELLQIIFISSVLITALSGLPLSLNFFYGKYDTLNEKNSLFGKFFYDHHFTNTVNMFSVIYVGTIYKLKL